MKNSNQFTFQTAPNLSLLVLISRSILNRSASCTALTSLTAVLYSESCVSWSVPSTAISTLHFTRTIAYIVLSHDYCFYFKFRKTFVLVTKYRVRQKNLTIFKLKWKYTIFLFKFITKIIFISKHFNYNIHFLNIVSVRWRPLLSTHSHKHFWKFCITRCSMVGEIAATSSLMFCFRSTVVLGFFSYTLPLRYPQRKKYCD